MSGPLAAIATAAIALGLAAGSAGAVLAGGIAPNLADVLASADPDERIPVVVLMERFPDRVALLSEVRELSKSERRATVVRRMKSLAAESQAPVHALIAEGGLDVHDVRILWGVNGIALDAPRHVVEQLGALDAVRWVLHDPDIDPKLLIDVDLEKVLAENPPRPGRSLGPFPKHDGNGDGPTGGDASGPNPSATVAGEVVAMGADRVWNELGFTGEGVIVAVVDSGVDRNHPDLADHIWTNLAEIAGNGVDDDGNGLVDDTWGWDFCSNDNEPTSGSHGTQVAGQVGGDGTNGTMTGMAPDVEIMALGINCGAPSSWWQSSDYAIEMGAHLITQSYSLKWPSDPDYEAFRRQTDTELAAGVIHTNSTGNTGTGSDPVPYNVATPGNVPPPWLHPDQTIVGGVSSTIGVANINFNTDNIEASSPYGPAAWEDIRANTDPNYPHVMPAEYKDYPHASGGQLGLLKPDIAAYGAGTTSTCPGTGYCGFGGTSSATPHTAGVVALMLSANPDATPEEIAEALFTTAQHRGDPGKNNRYGVGLVQAFDAVDQILAAVRVVSVTYDDSDQGNNDGAPDPGEEIVLRVTVENRGEDAVADLQGILTSSSPGLVVRNGFATWGSVPVSGTLESDAPHFSVMIDATTCTEVLEFQIELRYGGEARAQTFRVRVGEEIDVVFVDDDFESDLGWTSDPGTASKGQWVRDSPIGTIDNFGNSVNPPNDATPDPGTLAWVTGNGELPGKKDENNNDVDDGNVILLSPAFGSERLIELDLSYDLWYYAQNDSNDRFLAEISTDGGTNWSLAQSFTSGGGGWSRESIDLRSIVSPTPDMRLRFVCDDAGFDNPVECGVDGVLVDAVRVDCEDHVPSAAQAPNGIGASLRVEAIAGGHVRLSWTAPAVDATHDAAVSYRIERSNAPDAGFVEVGTALATEWVDIDGLADAESWYYRVVAVNAAGSTL